MEKERGTVMERNSNENVNGNRNWKIDGNINRLRNRREDRNGNGNGKIDGYGNWKRDGSRD